MKVQDMDRKLKQIAENMKDLVIEGTTRIDWNCLTERERVLFNKVYEIRDKYAPVLPPADVLMDNWALFCKAGEIIVRRAMDLFTTVMPKAFGGDEIEEYYFKLHFYNFLKDWVDCIKNVQKWTEKDRDEFLRDMKESGMMNKFFRFPRGWSEEDKRKVATTP